jgi:hypothetical protein
MYRQKQKKRRYVAHLHLHLRLRPALTLYTFPTLAYRPLQPPRLEDPSNIKKTRGKTLDFVALHTGVSAPRTYFKPPIHRLAYHCVGWPLDGSEGGSTLFQALGRATQASLFVWLSGTTESRPLRRLNILPRTAALHFPLLGFRASSLRLFVSRHSGEKLREDGLVSQKLPRSRSCTAARLNS